MAVELKYCERCGSLYVRRSNSEAKFCLPCIAAEEATLEALFFGGRRRHERNWSGSVTAVIAAAQQPTGLIEEGGRA